ncbi:MAG: glycosyltransferase family 2 protein [Mangrovicoccus sp.]
MTKNVRILLATYNGARYLPQQLQSFAQQTHRDWQIFASDDGSTDQTMDILRQFRGPQEQVVTLQQGPRQGFAANFLSLLCADNLTTGWCALSDQDDVWLPHRLENGLALLRDIPDDRPALACARTQLVSPDLTPIRLSHSFDRFSFGNALVQNVVAGNTILLNPAAHALIRKAGQQPVPYHDWWIYQLICGAAGVIRYDPIPALLYRQHLENIQGENRSLAARLSRARGFGSGKWTKWFHANLVGLRRNASLLTPEHQSRLQSFDRIGTGSPLSRLRAAKALKAHRQTPFETASLYLGAAYGLI